MKGAEAALKQTRLKILDKNMMSIMRDKKNKMFLFVILCSHLLYCDIGLFLRGKLSKLTIKINNCI